MEFKIGNKSKLRLSYLQERKSKNGTFYTGQASISKKKNDNLDWSKENTEYVNFNFVSFHNGLELKDGDKISLEDFYYEAKYYTNKDGKKVLGHNITANKVIVLDDDGKESKPTNATKIEVNDDELPF